MKNSFKVLVVIVFLAFSLAIAFTLFMSIIKETKGEPVVNFIEPENEKPYFIKTYKDGSICNEDFKIITIGDTHLRGIEGDTIDSATFTIIENIIEYQKPDLVVFAGDIAIGSLAEQAARSLAELFERHNQFWGYVLGNHDAEDELGPSRGDLVNIYGEYEHCIIYSEQGISGEGNCIINIKNSDEKVVQSLVFIDSGSYLTPEICAEYGFDYKNDYDFIKYDQIEWYKSEMQDIADENGEMPDSVMFIHIPLKEYRTAYNQALSDDSVIFGARREPECDSPYNTGMFDAILEIDSTKAVVCGHDHINDYAVEYMGIKLLYSLGLSYNSYFLRKDLLYIAAYQLGSEPQFNDGYTLFSVNKNGELTITPKYNQNNPSFFDGLTEAQREALFLDETLP
ncbi:MAG: metallophosphoesterase [Bacillota bacterium]